MVWGCMKQRGIKIGLRCLQGVVCLGFFLFGIAFVQMSSAHISYPWGTDYVEIPELSRAILLSKGESMYPSWETPPFQEGNYTPLFTLLHSIILGPMSFHQGEDVQYKPRGSVVPQIRNSRPECLKHV